MLVSQINITFKFDGDIYNINRVCFKEDYEHLFDVPQHSRTDNDVSGLAPIYIPAAG